EDVFKGVLKSCGLTFSLRGGRIGIVDPTATITPHNADLAITTARSEGHPAEDVTSQTLRVHSPLDRAIVKFAYDPNQRDFSKEEIFKSSDSGYAYRSSGDTWEAYAYGVQQATGYQQRFQALS